MKIIKPSKNEVFNELRENGCTWCGGKGCECYSRQLKACYEETEKRLEKVVKTEEEINTEIECNKKICEEIFSMI